MPQSVPDPVLTIRHLRKSFGEVEAVRDLSLDVNRGEVFGFLGPNGAGKTTAIRMICGLLQSDAGEVRLDGRNLRDDVGEFRRGIGLCPQEIVIWESLTCLEQLTFMGTQYDLPRTEARRRSGELLSVLGLSEKENQRAGTLSGGMKRRLNLALALVHDPDLLILDEPQAGLDPQSRILVREYIQALAETKTVILTTHEMDEAERLAHRVGIMDHGQLLVLDSPDGLKGRYADGDVLEIRVSSEPAAALTSFSPTLPPSVNRLESLPGTLRLSGPTLHHMVPILLKELESEELAPLDLTIRKPTLEDVFISLTGRGLRE